MNRSFFKKVFCIVSVLISILFVYVACTEIDELSNDNFVLSYEVTGYSPDEIELGDVYIDNKADTSVNTIYIPLLYGKYSFPMQISSNMVTSDNVYKVIGYDGHALFENEDSDSRFFIMAQNGETRSYRVVLKVKSHSEDNDIQSFNLTSVFPETVRFANEVLIDKVKGYVRPLYVEGGYPFSINADITISDSASFVEEPVMPLTFSTDDTSKVYTVKASSGAKKQWTIIPAMPALVHGSDPDITSSEKTYTGIDNNSFTYSLMDGESKGFSIFDANIDDETETVTFVLKRNGGSFSSMEDNESVGLSVNFDIKPGMQLFGMNMGDVLEFSSLSDEKTFYIIDNMSLKMRRWTIKIASWKSSATDLQSFKFSLSTGKSIVSIIPYEDQNFIEVNSDAVIDNVRGEVYVEATSVYAVGQGESLLNPWYATISVEEITASPSATVDIKPSYKFTDSGLSERFVFNVTAEDGTVREWKLFIKPVFGEKSQLCDIESFAVTDINPSRVMASSCFGEGDTLIINIEEGMELLPFSFVPDIVTSPYATIADWDYGTPVTVGNMGFIRSFTVIAEDGITSKTWVLKAGNKEMPQLNGAEVAGFTVTTSSPADFSVNRVNIDSDRGEVVIDLAGIGAFDNGYTIDYSMTVSAGAVLEGLPLRGTLTFDKLLSEKPFTVISKNGEEKAWSVKLSYLPRLVNGDLNEWEGNVIKGWANANNAFTTGTASTAGISGASGDFAAQLVTSMAPIVNKIAAASMFLGKFVFNLTQQGDPPLMTWFGIHFASTKRVVAVEADIYFKSGGDGSDKGSINLDMIHYTGSGTFEYHGFDHAGNKNATGVVHNKLIIGDTNGWETKRVELDYSEARDLDITHISIAFSSGAYGDKFIGQAGSVMKVDNVRIIYED